MYAYGCTLRPSFYIGLGFLQDQRVRMHIVCICIPMHTYAQVFFYIDPDFLKDRRMGRLDTMTLSYTFFKSNEVYS